jgi:hypothetical protein
MDRWAGLLNYENSDSHTITLAMSRIEDWDFASDGEYSVDIPYAQFGIMSLSGRKWS